MDSIIHFIVFFQDTRELRARQVRGMNCFHLVGKFVTEHVRRIGHFLVFLAFSQRHTHSGPVARSDFQKPYLTIDLWI
jgi:hypothetical protein